MKKPRIIFTKHALQRIKIRGIKEKNIIEAVENPHVIYNSDRIPGAKKLIRRVDGKEIFVVVLYKKNLILVITAGWKE